MRIGFLLRLSVFLVVSSVVWFTPMSVSAQDADMRAIALKKDAMAAYGNLDLEGAVNLLDKAAAIGEQLSANTVAQIYVSYGVVFVGGQGDNARGQDLFTVAQCLDASVAIDPLFSTPEVDMIFKMAQSRANPQTCPGLLANVSYQGNAASPDPGGMSGDFSAGPSPQQPMQAGGLPPCGVHDAPVTQRKSTELPLMVQIEPEKLATLDRIVLKYAYDGGSTYFDMDMKKGDMGWVTVLLSCAEGQITDFDPSSVSYYIEGYDMLGGLVCGHGSMAQPYLVTMDPGAPVVSGLSGMSAPQTCTECPPWDQDCHKNGPQVPCFSDEECLAGQWCSDMGFCEGDVGEDGGDPLPGGGDSPARFYVELAMGSGAGYVKAPNHWYVASAYGDPSDPGGTYFAYLADGVTQGSVGGLPLRARVGIMLNPRISLEVGMRLDLSAFWRKQKNIVFCADGAVDDHVHEEGVDIDGDGTDDLECFAPIAADNKRAFGVFRDISTGEFSYVESDNIGNSWLVNARVKARLINKKGNQFFLFGGVGYGHLYFAPKVADMDLDGTKDRVVATPGMINVEAGLGVAHYFNSHFGITAEIPMDLVLGENSSFGFNTDLMVGISFGG